MVQAAARPCQILRPQAVPTDPSYGPSVAQISDGVRISNQEAGCAHLRACVHGATAAHDRHVQLCTVLYGNMYTTCSLYGLRSPLEKFVKYKFEIVDVVMMSVCCPHCHSPAITTCSPWVHSSSDLSRSHLLRTGGPVVYDLSIAIVPLLCVALRSFCVFRSG